MLLLHLPAVWNLRIIVAVAHLELDENQVVLHEVLVSPPLWVDQYGPHRLDLGAGPLAAGPGRSAKQNPVEGVQGPCQRDRVRPESK